MEEIRDENGRFVAGHPGQKSSGAKSELRKKVLSFVEEQWENLPLWFDSLKAKDKLLFMVELLPYLMPRLKQVDATIMSEPVKRIFPFGGYTNSRGEFVEVDDDAFFYGHGEATREEIAVMFPPELKWGSNDNEGKRH